MIAHTPDALASALPAGISYPAADSKAGEAFTARWNTRRVAVFQAEKLAESGYVLLHPETLARDEATVERLAEAITDDVCAAADADGVCVSCQRLARERVTTILAALTGEGVAS